MASARDLILRYRADTSDLRKASADVRKSVQASAQEARKASQGGFGELASKASAAVGKGMSAAWRVASTAAKAGGAAVAAVGATAIAKGFKRLTAIEDATAALKGLGYTAQEAAKIINGPVLAAVKGTAFGIDEAAQAAQGALGAGVKNGKELQKYLTLVGDAATQSGTDFQSMALMMNKVQGAGKLTGDVLQQMAENGLQVMPMLAKALGKPQAEIQKMVSQGKISAAEFQRILQKNIGGAAQKAGDTTTGALKNMGAALGRVGAKLLNSVFPMFKDVLGGITGLFDDLGPYADKAGKKLGTVFGNITDTVKLFIGTITGKGADVDIPWMNQVIDAGAKVRNGFDQIAAAVKKINWKNFTNLAKSAGKTLGTLASAGFDLVVAAIKKMIPVAQTVAKGLTKFFDVINAHQGLFQSIAAGILAVVAALTVYNAITKTVAAAQLVLNAVMAANPIALVVLALVALGTALVVAYKKSETFRKIVDGAFAGIKAGAKAFASFFTKTIPDAFRKVINFVKSNWQKALFLNPVTAAVYMLVKHRDKIIQVFKKLVDWATGAFKKGWSAVKTVLTAPVTAGRKGAEKAIGKIRSGFTSMKTWVGGKWKAGWSHVSGWISGAVSKGSSKVGDLLGKSGLRDKFSKFKTWVSGTWRKGWDKAEDWIKHPIKSAQAAIKDWLAKDGPMQKAFRGLVTAAGQIMEKIKSAFGKPIQWVINNAIIPLISAIASVGSKVGLDIKVPAKMAQFARGGVYPGYTPGRDVGIIGVSGGEAIMRPEFTRAAGEDWVNQANAAARAGGVSGAKRFLADHYWGGFAGGGRVWPVGRGYNNNLYDRTIHSGVDFPRSSGTPIYAAAPGTIVYAGWNRGYGQAIFERFAGGILEAVYGHTSKVIRSSGAVGAGDLIGLVGSTGHSTGPHLHYEVNAHGWGKHSNRDATLRWLNGADDLGSGSALGDLLSNLNPLTKIKNALTSKASTLLDKFGSNPWTKALVEIPKKMITGAMSWAKDKLAAGEPAGSGVERWRDTIVSALKANGVSTSSAYVNAWLRQVQTESGGNPKAIQGISDINSATGNLARGLLQVIPPTFNAYKFPGHGDILNGLDNALAAIHYWNTRYHGNIGVIGQGHGYDQGGWLPPGVSLAVNRTNRPEPVLTGQQWDRLAASGGDTFIINVDGTMNDDATIRKLLAAIEQYSRRRGGPELAARSRKLVRQT